MNQYYAFLRFFLVALDVGQTYKLRKEAVFGIFHRRLWSLV